MLTLDLTARQGACGATLLTRPSVGSTVQFRTVETQPTNGGGNNPPQSTHIQSTQLTHIHPSG